MATDPSAASTSVADVTEQLMAEFGSLLSPPVVSRTVLAAGNSLAAHASEGTFPEMLAHLAHARLTALRLELLV